MSAAMKRLSTIIRPSNSSPPSPPKENGKNSIDAPAPAAPVDATPAAETSPKAEENPNGATTDGVNGVVDSAAPEKDAGAAPVSTDAAKDASSTAEVPKDKDVTAPAAVESKTEKEAPKAPHRRDPRDIGRSTIRRFSTILRSQAKENKDKEPTPPLPSQEDSAKAKEGETQAPEEQAPAAEEGPKETAAKENGTVEKNAKPAKATPSAKDKTDTGKLSKRTSSSFFTAAREGLQRTAKDVQTRARGQPGAARVKGLGAKVVPKAEAVPKIVKKGAAKGKRVVVITGASKGVGLEFVKQFASQPNMFVIALSRTAEKSTALKPIITASAKEGHNVRAIKLDVSSSRSIHNVIKDIVELTEGRVDILINAAGSRGDPALKIWDLKGSELEDELRNNLIGPLAFTNALIPYLKPMPPKEETKEETKEAEKEEKSDTKEEKAEEKAEAKEEQKDEKAEEKKEEQPKEKAETVEKPETTEVEPDAQDAAVAATAEPSAKTPDSTADKQEPAEAEAPVEKSAEGESAEPAQVEIPSVLPAQPFVLFLVPSDPIQNVEGAVPAGSSFAPSPRTLFSLSRAPLQVAIAKYAVGLGGKNIGIVGLERYGLHDPHSGVSEAQSVAGVIKILPELSIRDNGKLLKTGA